ncbi:MAG: nucleoid-associated protein [Spirochaetaceae bacterium]
MINNFIIHEIQKEQHTDISKFIPSKVEVTKDYIAESLVNELHKEITKSSKKVYGIFKSTSSSYFKLEFEKHLTSENYNLLVNSESFIGDINGDSLRRHINGQTLSTGGHIILIDYNIGDTRYFVVAMINNKSGKSVTISSDGIPTIYETDQIDFSALDIACRIDIDAFNNGDDEKNYLCFISGRQDIAKYFVDFIGCKKFNKKKINSENLVFIIEQLSHDYPEKDIIENAFNYIKPKIKNKEVVDLYQLSEYLLGEDNQDEIIKKAVENGILIDHSFIPSNSEIDKLKKFEFIGDWINKLQFKKDIALKQDIISIVDDSTIQLHDVGKLVERINELRAN